MYDIYMKNFLSGGSEVTTETLMYSIPIVNTENMVKDPVVKTEMGKTGTFEFSLYPTHAWYSSFLQMRTIARVVYDGDTIFRGRALTIDNTLKGEKKLHFEGDLAFLLDSVQESSKEEERSEITILQYLTNLLTEHNRQMQENGETDKIVHLGEVPGSYSSAITADMRVYPDEKKKYGSDSWQTTLDALEELQKQYGGYFRTRWINGYAHLDWLEAWFNPTVKTQTIEIAENLVDLASSAEVDNIFTALVPIGNDSGTDVYIDGYKTEVHGDNKRILVPQILSVFSDSELNSGYHSKSDYQNAVNKYGIIYKTQSFKNADTQEKLWEYATDWIKNNYMGGLTSFDLTALDMHHTNGTVQKYLCGDRIPVKYPDLDNRANNVTPMISKTLTAVAITYYLHNPEKNEYNVGIPNGILNKTYGSANSKSGSGGGGGSGAIGGGKNRQDDTNNSVECDLEFYRQLAYAAVYNASLNNERYQEILAENKTIAEHVIKASEIIVTEGLAGSDKDNPHGWRHKERFRTMMVNGGTGEFVAGMPLNSAYSYLTDPEQVKKVNAANRSLSLSAMAGEIGVYSTVDLMNGKYGSKEQVSNYMLMKLGLTKTGSGLGTIEDAGLTAWAKDRVNTPTAVPTMKTTGLTGTLNSMGAKFGLDGLGEQATAVIDGVQSKLSMFNTGDFSIPEINLDGAAGTGAVGKNGNDWRVKLNNTVTYTDKDGNSQTAKGFVSADDFNIPSIDSFKTKLIVVDTLIANKASIGSLEALEARVGTIEADYITATNLSSKIANISTVVVKNLTVSGNQTVGGNITSDGTISGSTVKGTLLYYGNVNMANAYVSITDGTYKDGLKTVKFNKADGTSTSITFNKGDTDAAYNEGWNDCIDAATKVTRYTRNAETHGGSSWTHYYKNPINNQYVGIGTGWYKTSSADAYTLPNKKK